MGRRLRPHHRLGKLGGRAVDQAAPVDRLVAAADPREPVDGASLNADDHQLADMIGREGGQLTVDVLGTSDDLDHEHGARGLIAAKGGWCDVRPTVLPWLARIVCSEHRNEVALSGERMQAHGDRLLEPRVGTHRAEVVDTSPHFVELVCAPFPATSLNLSEIIFG